MSPHRVKYQPHFPAMGSWTWGLRTRLAGHSHAEDGKWPCYVSLLTGLVSKPHFSLLPENAVWKQDYLQVEVLVLVYRMATEDSVATL